MFSQVPHHHRLYAGILTAIGSVAIYYLIQVERANVRFQDQATLTLRTLPKTFTDAVHVEMTGLRADVLARVDVGLDDLEKTEQDANDRVASGLSILRQAESDASDRLEPITNPGTGVTATLWKLETDFNQGLNGKGGAVQSIAELSGAYQAVPSQLAAQVLPAWKAMEPEFTCRRTLPDGTTAGYGGCYHAAITATLNETRNTLAQVQIGMKTFPEVAVNIKAATDASAEASKNAAGVLANLKESTRPLPRWARIGLGVAPPLASTASAIIGALALIGAL
jgi:hypothetical protein